jgi:hypothetical protein
LNIRLFRNVATINEKYLTTFRKSRTYKILLRHIILVTSTKACIRICVRFINAANTSHMTWAWEGLPYVLTIFHLSDIYRRQCKSSRVAPYIRQLTCCICDVMTLPPKRGKHFCNVVAHIFEARCQIVSEEAGLLASVNFCSVSQ